MKKEKQLIEEFSEIKNDFFNALLSSF